ncbi:hypothetical protein [Streptomyces capoamus]|uniref:Uncharacterized protein n=1 Tax=Streptomyces capoamus TaxID=68183 RepID=A0A919EX76_9ACTN|nr:hypothetical protein [Streptomyces capoamus]GGW17689.1 hypothetical protein GCM10010501_39150 [Streptomyces libani subsp. rufus]GHG50454.1 hypothetical protein GCM10018980_32440 [Streptomyces capoamus]
MSVTQQYLLDSYRARLHGEPEPPAPGRHDLGLVRELRDHRRFRAVLAGRPARGRLRRTLTRWLRPGALG